MGLFCCTRKEKNLPLEGPNNYRGAYRIRGLVFADGRDALNSRKLHNIMVVWFLRRGPSLCMIFLEESTLTHRHPIEDVLRFFFMLLSPGRRLVLCTLILAYFLFYVPSVRWNAYFLYLRPRFRVPDFYWPHAEIDDFSTQEHRQTILTIRVFCFFFRSTGSFIRSYAMASNMEMLNGEIFGDINTALYQK